ncbi:MAG: DUF4842 domain-containing protein [Bacteroidales bacterium]|nr:DUF4842 domain-containing protein [Bacteroidales bacterium]
MIKSFPFVALSALVLVACNQISEDDIEIVKVKKQLDKEYSASFTETFGYIDPEQTWGFDVDYSAQTANVALTRTDVNVNGNQWKEIPQVTDIEKKAVSDYVNMTRAEMKAAGHKYTEEFPENLVNYWVTHVWTGTDTYSTIDGTNTGIVGSSKMDHLQIADSESATITEGVLSSGWYHVNNFNRGDNTDWEGNTLITNSGTFDFAYNNSQDSRYHNKWIAVNGADISSEYAGYYYVCFDFIGENPYAKTYISNYEFWNPYSNNASKWENGGNLELDGYWTADMLANSDFTVTKQIWVGWDQETQTNLYETLTLHFNNPDEVRNISISNLVGGDKVVPANDVYTDWIIRLVAAEPVDTIPTTPTDTTSTDTIPVQKVYNRIMCEDLGSIGDFDFNDVVFDVEFVDGNAHIILRAAGGTMPLYIQGEGQVGVRYEVHDQFGVDVKTMVNTGNGTVTKDPVEIWLNGITSVDQIQVWVTNTKTDTQATYEVGANKGEAPQKINVPSTVAWSKERVNIQKTYPKFETWVGDSTKPFWE